MGNNVKWATTSIAALAYRQAGMNTQANASLAPVGPHIAPNIVPFAHITAIPYDSTLQFTPLQAKDVTYIGIA